MTPYQKKKNSCINVQSQHNTNNNDQVKLMCNMTILTDKCLESNHTDIIRAAIIDMVSWDKNIMIAVQVKILSYQDLAGKIIEIYLAAVQGAPFVFDTLRTISRKLSALQDVKERPDIIGRANMTALQECAEILLSTG